MAQQDSLRGIKVAILVTDGFEQVEMTAPRDALRAAGAQVLIVSPKDDEVQGWKHHEKGDKFKVDVPLAKTDATQFDALVLPGGVINPDTLRTLPAAVELVRAFARAGKPIAAVCHGPWMLVEADVVRGRTVTSWPSIRTDLKNAGAAWVDREVVRDKNLVTSRKPDDLPAFSAKAIELFGEARGAAAQSTHA